MSKWRLRALVALAAVSVALAGAQSVSAAGPQPFHVIAGTQSVISATGWRGSIQIRPAVTVPVAYHWIGGYLADGTFVQAGIALASPAVGPYPRAFVWHMTPGSTPLYFDLAGAAVGDWYAFEATRSGAIWSYRMTSPNGVTATLLNVANGSNLATFQADAETWMDQWAAFPVASMRAIAVRSGSTWTIPHLVFGASEPVCGEAEIKATPGLNLVFRPTAGGSPCYVVLS